MAIDLALARGGDQAVIKEGSGITYYGAVPCIHCLYILQQGELIFFQLLKVLFLQHDKILICLNLLNDPVDSANVLADLPVYQRYEERASGEE